MIGRLLLVYTCLTAITAAMCAAAYEDDKEVVVSGTTDSGEGSEPTPWSYSFLKRDPRSKAGLFDSNSGKICFEDDEWIVTTDESNAYQSNKKTDLVFYSAKTLEFVGAVQIPNCLKQFGRLPRSDIFFAVTEKYGKYNFDDAPLVLTVVNIRKRKLERIQLAEQDHWLANLPLYVAPHSDGLTLQLTAERFQEFNKAEFSAPDFSALKISYENKGSSELPKPTLSVPRASRSMQFRSGETAYFGEGDDSGKASEERRKANATFIDGRESPLYGTHLVRLLRDGALQDIHISSLSQRTVALPGIRAAEPGIFESGALRCTSDGAVVLIDQKTRVIPIGKSKAAFDRWHAFALDWKDYDEGTSDSWQRIGADGKLTYRSLGEALQSLISESPSVVVRPEAGIVIANSRARNGDGGTNVFRVFSLDEKKEIMRPLSSVTGLYGEASYVKVSEAAGSYRLASIITDFFNVNGNQRYSILLQDTDTGGTSVVAENLSGLPDVLQCRVNDDGHVLVLFSCATMTRYVDVDTRAGKVTMLQEWAAPSGFGPSLFAVGSNLLFVPKTYGYEVHKVFQSSEPGKVCDVHLGASGAYAVSLPNGFYAGSPECEHLLALNARGGLVDASVLARWRNRPAEVIKALDGKKETVELLTRVTNRWLKRIDADPTAPEPCADDVPRIELAENVPLWAQSDRVTMRFRALNGSAARDSVVGEVKSLFGGASSAIERLSVRVNGVEQVGASAVEKSDGEWVQEVRLAEGQNWIEASAIDANGRSSNLLRFRVLLAEAEAPVRRYIIALGVSEYSEAGLNLAYAAKDAQDVVDTLRGTAGECETLVLLNGEVTKDSLAKIGEFLKPVRENDEVVVFCAGHGVLDRNLDYVFASHDFDPERPAETGIKLDDLIDTIGKSKSLKRLLLLDTCHAGQIGEREEILLAQADNALPKGVRAVRQRGMSVKSVEGMNAESQQRFIEEMFSLPGLHRGINVIGASGGAEFALESEKWNNGVFTAALIEALRDKEADANGDGRVGVAELRSYLADRVSKLTGGAQKPSVVAFERDQDFDIIKVSNQKATRVVREESAINTGGTAALAESNIPMSATNSAEEVIRAFFAGLGNRNESEVSQLLDDRVDYYSSGKTTKTKVLADIKADWKRWSRGSFHVSNFQSEGASTLGFVLEYELDDGKRPRSGKLNVTADVTGSPLRITRLKYKVIAAD